MNHPITNLESRIEQLEESMSSSSNVLDHYVENVNTGTPTILGVQNQWAVIPGSEITYTMPSGTTKLIYSFDFDFGKNGETWNDHMAYDDGALSFRIMARMDSSDPDHFFPIRQISHVSRYLTAETKKLEAAFTAFWGTGNVVDFKAQVYHKTPWSGISGKIMLNGTMNYGSEGFMGQVPDGQRTHERYPIVQVIALL